MKRYDELSINYQFIIKILKEALDGKYVVIKADNDKERKEIEEYFTKCKIEINNLKNGECEVEKSRIKKILPVLRNMEKYKKDIAMIDESFRKKRINGLSLYDMYLLTGSILYRDEYKQQLYTAISKDDELIKLMPDEIATVIQKIHDVNLVSNYIKFRKFNENSIFNCIKEKIVATDINIVLYKINGLLNNKYALVPPLTNSEYTDEFISRNIWSRGLNEIELRNMCDEVNKAINGDDEEKYYTPNWKSVFNIRKHKLLSQNNKLLDKVKETKVQKIYDEYEENIENLNIYYNSFSFLKKVFNDEFLEVIPLIITDSDEFEKYLKNAFKVLTIFQNYRSIQRKLINLGKLEEKILSLCYEITKDKRKIISLIEFLPNLLIHNTINNIHLTEEEYLLKYRDFPNIVVKLKECIDIINSKDLNNSCILNNVILLNESEINEFDYAGGEAIEFTYNDFKDYLHEDSKDSISNVEGYNHLVINEEVRSTKIILNIEKEIRQIVYELGLKINNCKENSRFLKVCKSKDSNKLMVIYIGNVYNMVNDTKLLLELMNEDVFIEYVWIKELWEQREQKIKYLKAKLNNFFTK